MRRRSVLQLALVASPSFAATPIASTNAGAAADANWVHAYAAFGEPKYPRGFDHFEYVNPAAPKGGTLYLPNPDRRTAFDKFNPFTIRGSAPAGLELFMLQPLAVFSADEPLTMYGLLAEEMLIASDKSAITFRLHPKAQFSNGEPVTAFDVKYTFDSLNSEYADPKYRANFGAVTRAVIVDASTIRFELSVKSSDPMFKLGAMLVFSHTWGEKPGGGHKRFDDIVDDMPLTSGPYTLASQDSGRRLELKRNPNYWAANLAVQRGFYNFDRIIYRYYKDDVVSTEAFKAGEYDIVKVYGASIWVRQHKGPKWDDGRIVKTAFPSSNGVGLQAYELNTRRQIFQDIRVREALNLTFDWETNNRRRLYKRANSVFNNSEFAAAGMPSIGELKLLEPYRAELPSAVFGPAFVAPRTDGGPNALRGNLLKARALLEAAGWKLAPDGLLRNAKGEAFVIEYLAAGGQDQSASMNPWRHNADKLGIQIKDRYVDYALFVQRLTDFDFDMVTIVEPAFTLPAVGDYVGLYSSKTADEKGSDNLRGAKSKAADNALAAMGSAATMDDFRDACRALDRIVMWSYWQVPELYGATENASYWNKFGMPAVRAKYFQIDNSPILTPLIAWPLITWWIKDPSKR